MVGSEGEFWIEVGMKWKSIRMGNYKEIERIYEIYREYNKDIKR